MKYRTALVTAGSVAAVVVAGGTAIAANLGILTSSTAPVGDLTVSSPVLGEVPPARVVTVQDEEAVPAPLAPDDLAAYAVEDAGLVTLRREGSQLVVDEVVPNLGWQATIVGQGPLVEVTFTGHGRTLRFLAEVRSDEIVTRVDEVTARSGGRYDDDRYEHDDDRYEHDDDHEGREYEGYEDDD